MSRLDNEEINPCVKEQKQTQHCLNQNNYDQSICEPYFDNYNVCKKFWGKVRLDRRRKGIKPELPTLADRPSIKEEFMKRGN